jgi:hypothetical protein
MPDLVVTRHLVMIMSKLAEGLEILSLVPGKASICPDLNTPNRPTIMRIAAGSLRLPARNLT